MRVVILLFLSLIFGQSATRGTTEWTQFRGPGGQGHAPADTAVPLRWSSQQQVAWKVRVPGRAWSTPVALDERIYVTTAVTDEDDPEAPLSLRCLALNLVDGSTVWEREVFRRDSAGRQHEKNTHASPTPVLDGDALYVHFGHHGTARLEAATGEVVWRRSGIYDNPVHGTGGSPALVGECLIFSCDARDEAFVIALDKETGEDLWRAPRNVDTNRRFSFSTPLAIEVAGQTQVISAGSGAVMAYDPQSGKEIWRCYFGDGFSVVPRPVYAGGLVLVCTGFMSADLIAIDPRGRGDVTDSHVRWQVRKRVPQESSPIVVDQRVYFNDDQGNLTAVDLETGEQIYQERINGRGGFSASPVYAGGHLFFHNGDGITTVVRPDEQFVKVAENQIDAYGLSSLAVVANGFLLRTEDHLWRLVR